MVVKLIHAKEFSGTQELYMTEHQWIVKYNGKPGWMAYETDVDIPERFKPKEHEGRVMVMLNGVYVGLNTNLTVGKFGEPVIQWKDEQLGCERSVSLKRVEEVRNVSNS